MRAKELQLGDWVNSHLDGHPVQLDEDLFYTIIKGYDDGIEPIPLSSEILEKNGWGCLPDEPLYDWWSWRHNGCMLYLNLCGDTAEIEIFGREIYIHYVHELQRALRCCGLWDLAENFKV